MTMDYLVTRTAGKYDTNIYENPDEDLTTKIQFSVQTLCNSSIVCLSYMGDLVAL